MNNSKGLIPPPSTILIRLLRCSTCDHHMFSLRPLRHTGYRCMFLTVPIKLIWCSTVISRCSAWGPIIVGNESTGFTSIPAQISQRVWFHRSFVPGGSMVDVLQYFSWPLNLNDGLIHFPLKEDGGDIRDRIMIYAMSQYSSDWPL